MVLFHQMKPLHYLKELYFELHCQKQVQIFSFHAQRSGDYCDVLADSIGMCKLENHVLFNLCIRAMVGAGIIFEPFVAEKNVFSIHVRLLGTIILESEFHI